MEISEELNSAYMFAHPRPPASSMNTNGDSGSRGSVQSDYTTAEETVPTTGSDGKNASTTYNWTGTDPDPVGHSSNGSGPKPASSHSADEVSSRLMRQRLGSSDNRRYLDIQEGILDELRVQARIYRNFLFRYLWGLKLISVLHLAFSCLILIQKLQGGEFNKGYAGAIFALYVITGLIGMGLFLAYFFTLQVPYAKLLLVYKTAKKLLFIGTAMMVLVGTCAIFAALPLREIAYESLLSDSTLLYSGFLCFSCGIELFLYTLIVIRAYQMFCILRVYKVSGILNEQVATETNVPSTSAAAPVEVSPARKGRKRRRTHPRRSYQTLGNPDSESDSGQISRGSNRIQIPKIQEPTLLDVRQSHSFVNVNLQIFFMLNWVSKFLSLGQMTASAVLLSLDINLNVTNEFMVLNTGEYGYWLSNRLEIVLIALTIINSVYAFLTSFMPLYTLKLKLVARSFYSKGVQALIKCGGQILTAGLCCYPLVQELGFDSHVDSNLLFQHRYPLYLVIGLCAILSAILFIPSYKVCGRLAVVIEDIASARVTPMVSGLYRNYQSQSLSMDSVPTQTLARPYVVL